MSGENNVNQYKVTGKKSFAKIKVVYNKEENETLILFYFIFLKILFIHF